MLTELKNHALAAHHLTVLRNRATSANGYRTATMILTQLLVAEAARPMALKPVAVDTPLEPAEGFQLEAAVVFVPILRAGLGMLNPALSMFPDASVGYIGLERDEATAVASCYYSKMPALTVSTQLLLLDPMLATGGSAVQAVDRLKALGAGKISMVSIIAAPEGVEHLASKHPEVDVFTAIVDRQLDEKAYIRPGLGDFGDRLFGT